MPRRGGGLRKPAPARRAPPPAAPAPAPVPAHAPPSAMAQPMAQPRQPGLMAQMAATAGGVAIGSAVGHTIGHAMTGGMSGGGGQQEVQQQQAPVAQAQPYQQAPNPCEQQLKQFLECAQTQSDFSMCEGFNQVLKECRIQYGIPLQ